MRFYYLSLSLPVSRVSLSDTITTPRIFEYLNWYLDSGGPRVGFFDANPGSMAPSSAAVCRVIESCSTKRGLHVKNHQEFVPDCRHANRSISVKYFMVAVTRIRPFLGYLDAVPGRGSEGMSGIMLSNTFCSSTMIPLCSGSQS